VADLPPVRGFLQAQAVCRGDRDLVMQAGDSRAETGKPGRKPLWLAVDALALPLVHRHILRQPMRFRSVEQLLR
jgi:hypothetical protein